MNSRFQKITLIGVLLLLILGGGYYLTRSTQPEAGPDSTTAGQSRPASSATAQPDPGTKLSEDALTAAKKYWRIDPANVHWDKISKAEIDRDLSSKDSHVRARALGDLLNTRFKREEVIAMLSNYLDHADVEIRFQAARLLFILGSDAGREVMVSLLQAGARGESIPEQLVFGAAQILYQYRQPFDTQLLIATYAKTKSGVLKSLMVLEQLPEAKGLVADELNKNSYLENNAIHAGILRMDDASILAKLRLMLELPRPYGRMAAHWAWSQITGSEADLGYVTELAKQRAGLLPKTPAYDQSLALDAIRLLSTTASPQATDALKQISDHAAKTGDNLVFDLAFASLYYVQKDYAYVDQKVVELMTGPKDKPGFSTVWKIAAERRTPELELLAVERNPGAYKRHFILEQGRPAEYWIYQYLSSIPADLLPPVRQ